MPLAGLFVLKPGVNTVGSAAASDVRLPSRVPASVGRFVFENNRVRFEPVRLAVARSGQATVASRRRSGMRVARHAERPARQRTDRGVGRSGSAAQRARDRRHHVLGPLQRRPPIHQAARSAKRSGQVVQGLPWFPIDERYRVTGRFIKDPAPREIPIPTLMGDIESGMTEGLVELTLNGTKIRMRPVTTRPGRLWFIFRDATAGKETYEAARFLYADLQDDGTTVLDFNEAYNPPCAFNEFTTCPLPLPENRLTVRIPAGEMNYKK